MIRPGKRNVRLMTFSIAVLLTIGAGGAFARFLVDDTTDMSAPKEQPRKETVEPEKKTVKPAETDSLPPDTPRNITVTMIPGEFNSVQITWEALPEVRDSFIILRSNFIQNTPDALMSSVPIKSVPADKLRVVLDRNLLPGRYYYAIVPKSKFDARKVQLFPGENYATNPVVIQSELTAGDSRTVAMLKAVTIEDRSVLLTWEPIASFNGELPPCSDRRPGLLPYSDSPHPIPFQVVTYVIRPDHACDNATTRVPPAPAPTCPPRRRRARSCCHISSPAGSCM